MNNDDKAANYRAGVGFPGLLTLLFIGLKLTGNITWSWWWVLSPMWIAFVVWVVTLLVVLVIVGLRS